MKTPCISIILPSLNMTCYIRECLESVLKQTLREIEILCVDAGSIDGTIDIIEDYCAVDSRVRLIHSPEKSYGYQMNLGIREARGEYIGFVDTDDKVSEDMYAGLYERAKKDDLDMIRADYAMFVTKNKGDYCVFVSSSKNESDYDKVIDVSSRPECMNYPFGVWSGIYRREFLLGNDISYNESPGASFQDNGFWVQVCAHAKKAMFMNGTVYYCRRDNESSSVLDSKKVLTVCDEFSFVENKMKTRIKQFEGFREALFLLCAKTYIWNFSRVSPDNYETCLNRAKRDFCRYYTEYHVTGRDLSNEQKEIVRLIMEGGADSFLETTRRRFELLEAVKENKCFLYGAGVIGQNAVRHFVEKGLYHRINGFVVSKREDAGSDYMGISTYPLEEVPDRFGNNCMVIITASEKHHDDMIGNLKREGFEKYMIFQ